MTTEESASGGGGFLHLLPMQGRASLTCTAVSAAMLPWGSPSFLGVVGHRPDDDTRWVIEAGYEWPTNWLKVTQPLTPFEMEWLHVHRFRADHLLATGLHPFWGVEKGADPPDVLVQDASGSIGIECTRFALEERQWAHGLFREVRQRVLSVAPEHFAHLRGHIVYLWFTGDDSVLSLPHRRTDLEAATELVEALAAYRPDPDRLWMAGSNGLPDPAPPLPMHETSAGASFYAVPLVNAVPDSLLFNVTGFELGFAYTTTHEANDEGARLAHTIHKKDECPENDWLLISAGAPDNLGLTYPAEEAVLRFVLEHGRVPLNLTNLQRVTAHFWSEGRAEDLWPERRELFQIYAGGVPASRQIKPFAPPDPGRP